MLALLKYRPAPFYILDEIDAALDLSHTENIGTSLTTVTTKSWNTAITQKLLRTPTYLYTNPPLIN
jgi:structural maintenance of chromosome 2